MRELTGGRGPDAVIDAVGMEAHGAPGGKLAHTLAGLMPDAVAKKVMETAGVDRLSALSTAFEIVRRGGTVSLSGVYGGTDAEDAYAGSSVPGEFRRLTGALGAEQVALTLIRVPPHSDFEQGTGHFHAEIEEVYVVTRGTLTMRFGEAVETVDRLPRLRVVTGATGGLDRVAERIGESLLS